MSNLEVNDFTKITSQWIRLLNVVRYIPTEKQAIMANLVECSFWILRATFEELIEAFESARNDPSLDRICSNHAELLVSSNTNHVLAKLSKRMVGADYGLRGSEQTGAHKPTIMGQGLLVKRMGKSKLLLKLEQDSMVWQPQPWRLALGWSARSMGAGWEATAAKCFLDGTTGCWIVAVTEGSATLKDAINATMRDWSAVWMTLIMLWGCLWTSSIPTMVSYFQSLIGQNREPI